MTNVVSIPTPLRMRCSSCGATAEASCDCGVEYVPAGKFSAKAVEENPSISARALAAQLGVNRSTIDRHRTRDGAFAPSDAVVGRDGKLYSEKVRPRREPAPIPPPPRIEETRATAPHEDRLAPFEADRAIRNTAHYVKGAFLNPPPGIRGCLREAMARASPDDVRVIIAAANFLLELKDAANGN